MTDTIDNALRLIANNPQLEKLASTKEGYRGACDLLEDWGWQMVEETDKGRTYRDARGNTKFLHYPLI